MAFSLAHFVRRRLYLAGLAAAVVVACSTSEEGEDSSADAITQVPDDWTAAQADRTRALDAYLASQAVSFDAFKNSTLGFTGIPYVLLKTMMKRYPDIWTQNPAQTLGFGPHPDDYDATGKLKPETQRKHKLPYGLAIEAEDPNANVTSPYSLGDVLAQLALGSFGDLGVTAGETIAASWEAASDNRDKHTERVFFSCGACHTGRVVVDGKMEHLYGAPNTELDAQMYTKLVMRTVYEKLISNPDEARRDPTTIKPNLLEAGLLFLDMYNTDPAFFYADTNKAKDQVDDVLLNFKDVLAGLIGAGVKGTILFEDGQKLTHAYVREDGHTPSVRDGKTAPPLFGPRPGQMDAYGVASGLVYLHLSKPESMPRLLSDQANFPDSHPFFDGLRGTRSRDQMEKDATWNLKQSAAQWLPHVPAPVDVKSLFQVDQRFHAGWDANQGAEARVIASGTSAVGIPDKINATLHASMNGFLAKLPAPPYPFAVDTAKAKKGEAIFGQKCAGCHKPLNERVFTVAQLSGVDPNRASVIDDNVTRLGLIGLMREACNGGAWCTPKTATADERAGTSGKRSGDNEYYRELRKPADRGYKADLLLGIWAQAPYLHNGSVPTLWHMLHPGERPAKFVRGNVNYDADKVGFVWDRAPPAGSYDMVHTSVFDTTMQGQSNQGHTFGAELGEDQKNELLEYLKVL